MMINDTFIHVAKKNINFIHPSTWPQKKKSLTFSIDSKHWIAVFWTEMHLNVTWTPAGIRTKKNCVFWTLKWSGIQNACRDFLNNNLCLKQKQERTTVSTKKNAINDLNWRNKTWQDKTSKDKSNGLLHNQCYIYSINISPNRFH